MPNESDQPLLEVLLNSWDRNNAILINLLQALPTDTLHLRPAQDSPSLAQFFHHMHYVRLVFVAENVPECALELASSDEWADGHDPAHIAHLLTHSAQVVRQAVEIRTTAGRPMDLHFDHPMLLLQHLIWHEGYHHGQIKLILKQAGSPLPDTVAGPLTWGIWMRKSAAPLS